MPSEAIIVSLIGLASLLISFALRDVLLQVSKERIKLQRTLLELRLEQVYTPLDHLAFLLLQEEQEDKKQQYINEIGVIVGKYGHLLSSRSLAAFYTLMIDLNTGAALLQQSFATEYEQLVSAFYGSYHSVRNVELQVSA